MDDKRIALHERIEHSLTNQPPREDFIEWIELIREHAKSLGRVIIDYSPISREQSLALTHLEETVMWAVKGIVCNQGVSLKNQTGG